MSKSISDLLAAHLTFPPCAPFTYARHTLGVGNLWYEKGLIGGGECPYAGYHAVAEFQKIGGCSVIPTGDFCVHWSEKCMLTELMTSFINPLGPNPLSRITIGSLHDMGYQVDYSWADSFTINDLNATMPGCVCNPTRRHLRSEHSQSEASSAWSTLDAPVKQKIQDVGREYLDRAAANIFGDRQRVPSKSQDGSDAIYVGNQIVFVIAQVNEQIISVAVDRDSLEQ